MHHKLRRIRNVMTSDQLLSAGLWQTQQLTIAAMQTLNLLIWPRARRTENLVDPNQKLHFRPLKRGSLTRPLLIISEQSISLTSICTLIVSPQLLVKRNGFVQSSRKISQSWLARSLSHLSSVRKKACRKLTCSLTSKTRRCLRARTLQTICPFP